MAPIAARKARQIAGNAAGVIAIELIAAAQGVDFHAPLKTSPKLRKIHSKVRELSPHFTSDRYWADDLAELQKAVLSGAIGTDVIQLA
jgi:histidine ammonia-lyase